jgi:hypothetical protein
MTRFIWPAAGMVAAMIVLFAGAFGDLGTWRREWPAIIARTGETPAPGVQTSPPVPGQPESVPGQDNPGQDNQVLQHQALDLRARIAQETNDLAALHASADKERRELASIREQRQTERAALARTDASRHAADDYPPGANPVGAPPSPDRVASSSATQAAAPPEPVRAAPSAPGLADTARGDANAASVATREHVLAARRLVAARAALASGRRARARALLSLTRSQMMHWPPASGQPDATAGSPPVTAVENATSLLNHGDRDGALRAIDQALAAAGGDASSPPRRTDRPNDGR